MNTMMNTPLTMSVLMDRGPQLSPDKEIVSKMRDQTHRYTYADLGRRARQLAHALTKLGVRQGDRVATLAWNGYRHLEVYYAAPCMGAVLHTLNLRLSTADLPEFLPSAHAEPLRRTERRILSTIPITPSGENRTINRNPSPTTSLNRSRGMTISTMSMAKVERHTKMRAPMNGPIG